MPKKGRFCQAHHCSAGRTQRIHTLTVECEPLGHVVAGLYPPFRTGRPKQAKRAPGSTFHSQATQARAASISLGMQGKHISRLIAASTLAAALSFFVACNYSAAPEKNASMSEQESSHEPTPAGGGSQTTNKRSVAAKPPVAENTRQGSAVPPAAADQTRPHPQQQ